MCVCVYGGRGGGGGLEHKEKNQLCDLMSKFTSTGISTHYKFQTDLFTDECCLCLE